MRRLILQTFLTCWKLSNISAQAPNSSDCRIESNRNFFCPNWNALICTSTCTHLCRAQDVSCCCSVLGLYVGVGHGRAPCKNGRTDRDAALNVDYGQPKEPCKFIGWGPDAQREGALWAFILWHAQTCPVNSVSIIRQGAAAMRPLATTTVAACFEIATPSLSCIQNHIVVYVKKVKFSHTRYRALVPELIPVYRQSARRWREVNHAIDLAVGCRYFLPGLRLPP